VGLGLACLWAGRGVVWAADYEDIVLANKVVARIRDCGPYGSIWQRAARINQNINDAFEREDVGHPRMSLRLERGVWIVCIGNIKLIEVLAGDAQGAGCSTRQLATTWLANFRQRFPEAEPVIHMDDPFGQGSTGPRGAGHAGQGAPSGPAPTRHDEQLSAEARLVLEAFDQARANRPADAREADRELARDVLSKLNLGGAPPDEDQAMYHLLSAFIWVRGLSAASFEAKRLHGAELALERLGRCLKPLTRTAQNEAPPPPPAKVNLEYRAQVGDKTTALLELKGPVAVNDEKDNPLLGADVVMSANLTLEVTELKPESFVMRLLVSNAKVSANGVKMPLEKDRGEGVVEMDRYGRVIKVDLTDAPDVLPGGEQGVGLLSPVLGLGRFKGEPVGVGDSWAFDEQVTVGEQTVKMHFETKVAGIEDPLVHLLSTATADVPPGAFNLLGAEFAVRGGTLKLDAMQRDFDYQAGVPRGGKGKLVLDADGGLGEVKMKFHADLEVSLGPVPQEGGS